ncbi:MAG: YggT family protein [Solirubrobacteraceae bacterium]
MSLIAALAPPLLTAREQVASFLGNLIYVYSLVIIAYILSSLLLSLGLRIPYSRVSDAVLSFLREVSEPYLRVFRRILPPFGGFDLSPMIALFVLYIVRGLLVNAVSGG